MVIAALHNTSPVAQERQRFDDYEDVGDDDDDDDDVDDDDSDSHRMMTKQVSTW